jgi:Regulator of polyketide synthase expression
MVDVSRGRGLYGELMDCAARSGGIDSVINLAASKLGNSVVLLDADFKVLAHSTIFPIEDPLWAENIRQGYCSYEFVSAVAELDAVKNAPPTSDPVVVTCYASPLRKLSSKIFIGGKRVGFVMMLEKETPISPLHMELLPIISAAAGDAIARYAPYLISGNTVYQKLLYDLLIGASPEEIAPRIAGLQFDPHLCALCLRPARYLGQQHLKEQVAGRLVRLVPGTRFTFHENGIAALAPLGEAPDLSAEQLSGLEELAKAEFLRVGVSNTFFQPENFARRYAQARRALELLSRLKPEASVCRYADCSFYDLLNSAPEPESLGLYCHPALSILSRYDRDNGTDLYHTLGTYLECGGSVKLTAEALFIHRNSLNYRMERIRELTQADLEDSNTRFLLSMSYRIDHFIGHDR